jgi:hypothetical protein
MRPLKNASQVIARSEATWQSIRNYKQFEIASSANPPEPFGGLADSQ